MAGFFVGVFTIFLAGIIVMLLFERRFLRVPLLERAILIFGTGIMVVSALFAIVY
ncbi:hypothetical protein HOF40_00470 [Candidatus Parcubacteria bacterium]|jgi:hypothetical protein|nr:hypothetical protein [Candidatus Parcubacteria bacterium]MBT3948543.1 hypothetical protein [Candidatus Parcubacteria bacterium]